MTACLLWRHVFIIDVYAIKVSYAFRGVYVYANQFIITIETIFFLILSFLLFSFVQILPEKIKTEFL
jgi:hypothetical protein